MQNVPAMKKAAVVLMIVGVTAVAGVWAKSAFTQTSATQSGALISPSDMMRNSSSANLPVADHSNAY